MKARIYPIFLLLLCACAAMAEPVQVVVPNNLANAEGNSSMSDFLNSPTFRMQMVFDASQFGALANGAGVTNSLTSISFRLDSASRSAVLYVFDGASVSLSTTLRGPDNLSTVFSDNSGPDRVTVFNGALAFGAAYQPTMNPQPLVENITLTTPFHYSPSQGNLLVDIRGVSGHVLFLGELDAEATTSDSVSRVFAFSNLATTGTADTLGLVTGFNITVVPEPATWLFLALGLLLFGFCKRRKIHGT